MATLTQFCKALPAVRNRRSVLNRINAIQRRLEYYDNTGQALPHHQAAAVYTMSLYNKQLEQLDNNILTTFTHREPLKVELARIFDGLPEPTRAQLDEMERIACELMAEQTRIARGSELKTLLQYEVAQKAAEGWYMVFNTLTVRPGAEHIVFSPGSKAFREYIQKVETAVKGKQRAVNDAHTYFAVVETGTKGGRLHIHVLHFCRNLPRNSVDPNTGAVFPRARQLDSFRGFWPHGFSTPIMVRYSLNDAFGKAGYRWPLDRKTGVALEAKGPHVVANYVAKYITKNYNATMKETYLWRTRKTRNLGHELLSKAISTLQTETLWTLLETPTIKPKLNNKTVPPTLLRVLTIRELADRLSLKRLATLANGIEPQPSLLLALRASIRETGVSSLPSAGRTQTALSESEAIFNEAESEIDRAFGAVDDRYFQRSTHEAASLSTRPVHN